MNNSIYSEVNKILNELLNSQRDFEPGEPLLGTNGVMDSVTLLSFISICNDRFHVDILEDDINLKCLDSVEEFVRHINAKTID